MNTVVLAGCIDRENRLTEVSRPSFLVIAISILLINFKCILVFLRRSKEANVPVLD